jgi:hypothetical protein
MSGIVLKADGFHVVEMRGFYCPLEPSDLKLAAGGMS